MKGFLKYAAVSAAISFGLTVIALGLVWASKGEVVDMRGQGLTDVQAAQVASALSAKEHMIVFVRYK